MKNLKIIFTAAVWRLGRAWTALRAFMDPCTPPPNPSGWTERWASFHEKLFLE